MFDEILKLHIIRYCKEKNLSIPDLIKKFKANKIPRKTVLYFSLSGYKSFSKLIEKLDKK